MTDKLIADRLRTELGILCYVENLTDADILEKTSGSFMRARVEVQLAIENLQSTLGKTLPGKVFRFFLKTFMWILS